MTSHYLEDADHEKLLHQAQKAQRDMSANQMASVSSGNFYGYQHSSGHSNIHGNAPEYMEGILLDSDDENR